MTVQNTIRKAGVFIADGNTTTYPFTYRIPQVKDPSPYLLVMLADEGNSVSEQAARPGTDYTVILNEDQEATPGGNVIFTNAPAVGKRIAIISNVPETQEVILTSHDRFNPIVLNEEFDKLTILIQQLSEAVQRCIIVPATGSMTRDEMLAQVLDTAEKAGQYAALASETLAQAQALYDKLAIEGVAKGAEQTARVTAEGDKQVERVTGEGDKQADRLQDVTDMVAQGFGVAGRRETWTADKDVAAGETMELPGGVYYYVGHHQMQLVCNGLVLREGEEFKEIGTIGTESRSFSLTFDLKKGDEMEVWCIPLGRGDITELIPEIYALQDAFAELSQKVVFKDEASAKGE